MVSAKSAYTQLAKTLFIATAALLSLFYGLTLSPTVPGGDSGELITVAYGLGVAHPPGYPLYTLIAHLFSYLPFGSVALRVNLLSAVFSIAGALLLFHLLWKWLQDEWVACVVSLFFFLSPLIWRYSVVAEVFSLNNLFVLLLLTFFFEFIKAQQSEEALEKNRLTQKWVWCMAATLGFACSHHHTVLFLAVPLFLWLCLFHVKAIFRIKTFIVSVVLFLSGFTPYLYLIWAASKKDMFSWGEANTWKGFWTHFLRSEYGTFQLATGDENGSKMIINLLKYGEDLIHQTLVVALIPVLLGLWFLVKDKKKKSEEFLWTVVFVFVFYSLIFNYLANMDLTNRLFFDIQSRFWMFPNLLLCFLMAYGFVNLKSLKLVRPKFSYVRWTPLAFAIIYFPLQIALSYKHEDYSSNRIFEDVGRSTLESLPYGSIMLMRGDIYVNSVRYLQEVEGLRTDIKAIPLDLMWWPWMAGLVNKNYPSVTLPNKVYRYARESWDDFTLIDFFEANIDKTPIFIGKLREDELKLIRGKFRLKNMGYINLVLREGQDIDFSTYQKWVRAFDEHVPPLRSVIRDRSWEAFVYYNYWDKEFRRIEEVLMEASQVGPQIEKMEYLSKRLEYAQQRHHNPPPTILKNLGVVYQVLSGKDSSYSQKALQNWRKYVEVVSEETDPDVAQIRSLIQSLSRNTASEGR